MRRFFLVHVVADGLYLDDDTGIIILLFLNNRDNIGGNIRLNPNGVKARVGFDFLVDFLHRHLQQLRQTGNHHRINFGHYRHKRHRKPRTILHQQFTIAVKECPSWCHGGNNADAVAFRQAGIIVTLINLQVTSPADKHCNHQHRQPAQDFQPATKFVIFDQKVSLP